MKVRLLKTGRPREGGQTYSIPFRPSENETQPVLPHSGQIRLCRRNFFMKCFLDKRMFMKDAITATFFHGSTVETAE
ncbi:uncharacterized protein PHALS_02258 [Plasmopara halstedii]|uniref:Uncharacterized protein n=1 Tax=Plasmopara halstedii TaxID=4781 RepID=A0A0P1AWJ9_PLAHL|nr:uncharacterized protein PHALS_02258 [Plasmopara halstedii]CEG45925.1 hypothetical protein PHALS_02258 [Plasmopara halstedii]|eukprot:XP_024582294.1 hypothetical protein PHALS_02258 [Plasmopara halstedii]